ncbi:BTAD domain-containing putative transcriptional regulator [Streptomyces sp. NPDC050145]|uniref:AfsR/SARP family transcriptional regulator n=1 Tax=Streptomyces sp. NPDC050145 TaxID=3365602 RepID=UPI0037A8E911
MRFQVLGPVRMSPCTPTAAKPRVVLATLLVKNNSVVSAHSLIDELWGTTPPRTASTTLQVYVSHLRKALTGPGGVPGADGQPLLTQPPGYIMRVAPEELDLILFELLRAQGRSAYEERNYDDASRLLSESLALWTGPALSGIPHGAALQSTAIRLDELRSETLEQRISADLKLGRHQELIGELMALAHEFPMRESLHGLLMVALYRAGRQSDAIQAYHRIRRTLVDELGVEPDSSLKRILARLLASDPALAWHPARGRADTPAPGPRTAAEATQASPADLRPPLWLPPPLADFTGRAEELEQCTRLLTGTGRSVPRIVAVSGRPGVGKTALAVQLARGIDGFADGRVLVPLRDSAGRALTAPAAMAALLRRLLPPSPGGPAAVPDGLDDLTDRLQHITRARDLLLVLDDAVSEAQIRPLLAAVPDAAVLLTGRRPLAALEHARHLVLDGLGQEEAESLLLTTGGPRMAQDPAAVTRIARLCGRLPLALRVAAGGTAVQPDWTAAGLARRLEDERTRLAALSLGDLDVRSSLLTAYHEVSEADRHAFRRLGLAPVPDFPAWAAQSLLGTAPEAAEELLGALVRAQLLDVRQEPGPDAVLDGGVRYGYHTLLRSLALEMLAEVDGEEAVAETVGRLGRAFLLRARAADAQLTPGRDRLAGVLETACGELPAGDTAVSTPLRWFRAESAGLLEMVRRLHGAGLWGLTCALASATSGYYEACGVWDDWRISHELAVDAARRSGDALAEATLLRSLGDLAWQRRDAARAVDHHRHAARLFALTDDGIGAARCAAGEADVLLGQGEFGRADALYRQALERAAAEGDSRGCAEAERGLALVALLTGRPADCLDSLERCASAARALGDVRWRGYALRLAGQVRAAGRGTVAWPHLEVRPGVWLMSDGPVAAGALPAG